MMMSRDTADTQTARDHMAQSLRSMVEEIESLLKSAAKSGDAQFTALRERLGTQATHLRQQLDELEETAVHRARQAARATDQAVHTHPYVAIGIAAAVGAVVGVLLARRD
jgi:ElaB/YqjD/DUF883 family membrane-anchored ribosome-binding protein